MISVITDIWCDVCRDEWIDGIVGSTPNARAARAIARNSGWTRRRTADGHMIDVCPKCQKKHKEASE